MKEIIINPDKRLILLSNISLFIGCGIVFYLIRLAGITFIKESAFIITCVVALLAAIIALNVVFIDKYRSKIYINYIILTDEWDITIRFVVINKSCCNFELLNIVVSDLFISDFDMKITTENNLNKEFTVRLHPIINPNLDSLKYTSVRTVPVFLKYICSGNKKVSKIELPLMNPFWKKEAWIRSQKHPRKESSHD